MNHVEQNLTNEIVALLLKEDLHTRAIAEQLGRNHVTVLRKLRELTEYNIVDCRAEGKNKIYYLKQTIEARNAAMAAEIFKQTTIIAKYPVLRGIFRTAQHMPALQLILLYGSYAKGTATKESDIDIYIDTTDQAQKLPLEKKHSKISVKTGTFDNRDLLIREIIKEHVIIRGIEVYFDKTGLFAETA